MKPYEEIKEEVKKDLVSQYEFWNGQDSQYALQEKEKIQKYLNNLDEYTKQEIMRKTKDFAFTASTGSTGSTININTDARIMPFLEMVGEDTKKLGCVSIDGTKVKWNDAYYINAINEMCGIVAKEYGINFTPLELGRGYLNTSVLEGKDVDIALEKGSDETEEHFIDRKEQYELQRCALGYSVGTFESDIKEKYNNEREQLKKQQENIKPVENKEEQKSENIEQEKEDREQKRKEREQLEKQIFENQKKAYNDLNPLKKAWYKITNKAVKVDGTWILDEPVELSEENARSIR